MNALLQSVDLAVEMVCNGIPDAPVPDYVSEDLGDKVCSSCRVTSA